MMGDTAAGPTIDRACADPVASFGEMGRTRSPSALCGRRRSPRDQRALSGELRMPQTRTQRDQYCLSEAPPDIFKLKCNSVTKCIQEVIFSPRIFITDAKACHLFCQMVSRLVLVNRVLLKHVIGVFNPSFDGAFGCFPA